MQTITVVGDGHMRVVNPVKPEDAAETARRARFGSLPKRIRTEDTAQEIPASPVDPDRDAYNSDEYVIRCCGL